MKLQKLFLAAALAVVMATSATVHAQASDDPRCDIQLAQQMDQADADYASCSGWGCYGAWLYDVAVAVAAHGACNLIYSS